MLTAFRLVCLAAGLLVLAACSGEDTPYLKIEGGGFVFNYRLGEFFYGVSVAPERKLPEDARITAEFEDPSGGPPIRMTVDAQDGRMRYSFRTPPLQNVEADRPYLVVVSLEGHDGETLFVIEKKISSTIDQQKFPEGALTEGPGYKPTPGTRHAPGQ